MSLKDIWIRDMEGESKTQNYKVSAIIHVFHLRIIQYESKIAMIKNPL